MAIRYWEFEDAALKEKLKNPNVREIARIYFDNETKAYRFSMALSEVKRRAELRLKDCPHDLPVATWKRYLDFGVTVGILKHEGGAYSLTDRYTRPLRNISVYIKSWAESQNVDDLGVLFAAAHLERQVKRGGRKAVQGQQGQVQAAPQPP
ncbi:MAG: hypothetical protein M1354_02300 [Candidatus Marsarchaeota archaeon]|jgi:hypothetical protein|nr:hypothetical protein [Candidatus Marsarchaeota archaeon]